MKHRPMRDVAVAVTLAAALLIPASASAVTPDEQDPRKIMEAIDKRDDGDKATGRMKMTITDASGSERERIVRTRGMDFPGATKQLILFESPADVRNTGLLTVDYDDGGKVDDQWLYLPAMRKTTRIASSAKSGPFMGSDLSFADMTGQSPDQYDFTMVDANARVGDEACWLIETRARTQKAKDETGYVKSHVWVSKAKVLPIQAKNWVREGKKIKLMRFANFKQINGVWIAHKISARTKQSGKTLSTTVLRFSNMKLDDPSVSDADFSQRRLEKGI